MAGQPSLGAGEMPAALGPVGAGVALFAVLGFVVEEEDSQLRCAARPPKPPPIPLARRTIKRAMRDQKTLTERPRILVFLSTNFSWLGGRDQLLFTIVVAWKVGGSDSRRDSETTSRVESVL
jgi:hypothetical protein